MSRIQHLTTHTYSRCCPGFKPHQVISWMVRRNSMQASHFMLLVCGVGGRRGSMSKSTNYSSSQGSSWNTLKNKILILRGIVVAIKIFSRIVIAKIIIWRCHVGISSSWVNINHMILVKVDSRGDYANMGSSNNDFGNDDPADYFDHDYNALQDQYFVFWRCFTKNLVMKNKLWTSTLIPSCHQPQWNPHQQPELGEGHMRCSNLFVFS